MLEPFYNGFNKVFHHATGSYMTVAGLFTRKLVLSVGLLAFLTFSMGGLFTAVPGGFVPEEDQGYFLVNIQLPDAASLERTDHVALAKLYRRYAQRIGRWVSLDAKFERNDNVRAVAVMQAGNFETREAIDVAVFDVG